jgi:hypothetical protein
MRISIVTLSDSSRKANADVEEIINIQPSGNKSKPYQVKQVRNILLKYEIGSDI